MSYQVHTYTDHDVTVATFATWKAAQWFADSESVRTHDAYVVQTTPPNVD